MSIITIGNLNTTKELDCHAMNEIVGGYSFSFNFMGSMLSLDATIDGGVVDSTATIDHGESKEKRRVISGPGGPHNTSRGKWEKV